MAFIDTFNTEDYTQDIFDVADGVHNLKIVKAETKQSKTGKHMIVVTYVVQECTDAPYIEYYCEGEYFNRNMSRFFDAFNIRQGDFNFNAWIGHYGKAMFDHHDKTYTDQNGITKTTNKCRIKYLIVPNNQPAQNAPQQLYRQAQQSAYPQGSWQ